MKRIFVLYVVLSICAAAFSQIKFPEIKWKSDSLIFIREKEALRYGVETFSFTLKGRRVACLYNNC